MTNEHTIDLSTLAVVTGGVDLTQAASACVEQIPTFTAAGAAIGGALGAVGLVSAAPAAGGGAAVGAGIGCAVGAGTNIARQIRAERARNPR